jgi:phospholipase/carboxylesterase
VLFINAALEKVIGEYNIDRNKLAIGGFSDGASYALSLGLINGDLFTQVIAFSPGFFFSPLLRGKPEVYISHGVQDRILPIDPCSRRIVPRLQNEGYNITYREFNDEHLIPDAVRSEAVSWFLG